MGIRVRVQVTQQHPSPRRGTSSENKCPPRPPPPTPGHSLRPERATTGAVPAWARAGARLAAPRLSHSSCGYRSSERPLRPRTRSQHSSPARHPLPGAAGTAEGTVKKPTWVGTNTPQTPHHKHPPRCQHRRRRLCSQTAPARGCKPATSTNRRFLLSRREFSSEFHSHFPLFLAK